MTYREQLEHNFRREIEQLRARLGPEAELVVVEQSAAEFIEHECNVLNELVELFVHADERAGVLERAAQRWPWSNAHDYVSQIFWRMQRQVLTFTAPEYTARVWPDLIRVNVNKRLLPVALEHARMLPWVTEGLAVSSAKSDPRPHTRAALEHNAGIACVFMALPELVRHALDLWLLLAQIEVGDLRHVQQKVAPTALDKLGIEPTDDRVGALAASVQQHIKRFRQAVPLLREPPPATAAAADGCARQLDLAFADYIAGLGDEGKSVAADVREASAARLKNTGPRWHLWRSDPAGERFLTALAHVAWIEEVRPFIKRNTPALVYPVHEDVVRIHSRTYSLVDKGGQRSLVFDDGAPIAIAPAMPTLAEDDMSRMVQLITAGVRLLGSVAAHRVLRWEVASGCERVMRGEPDARALIVDGGWTALAELLGLGKKRDHVGNLRAIVHAQSAVTITLPDGSRGNMLALRDRPPVGQRRGRVEIVLGTMLLPHYIYELAGKGRELRESKRLVPIVELPPFVGRNNDHGAQATASMIVVRELRVRAAELYRDGAVLIPLERWVHLFHEARLPSSLIGKVLDRWTHDGTDGPAFLMSPERDRFTLGDAHSRARDFLRDVGKLEVDRSEAGKLSVAAKRKRLISPRAAE